MLTLSRILIDGTWGAATPCSLIQPAHHGRWQQQPPPPTSNPTAHDSRRYSPYGGGLGLNQKCSICKRQLAAGGKFCTECAHHRGICYICGKAIILHPNPEP